MHLFKLVTSMVSMSITWISVKPDRARSYALPGHRNALVFTDGT